MNIVSANRTPEEAKDFISRAGLTNPKHIAAATLLVRGMKWCDTWNRTPLCFPMIGGTAAAHETNLTSSSYSPIVQGTAITHDWEGATPDADKTGQWIIVDQNILSLNLTFMAYVKRLNTSNTQSFMGTYYGVSPDGIVSLGRANGGTQWHYTNGMYTYEGPYIAQTGGPMLVSGSSFSATDHRMYFNGSEVASSTHETNSVLGGNRNLYFYCRYNDPGGRTDATLCLLLMGNDWLPDQHAKMATIVKAVQATLGRGAF